MRISLLCFDLTNNCLGRTYLLAKVLSRRHQVDVLGSLFTAHAPGIWPPGDTGEFAYDVVPGCKLPAYLRSMARLIAHLRGDVIYACKPRLPSFGVALLKKVLSGRRLILDIDDLESAWFAESDWRHVKRVLCNPIGPLYTRWMEQLSYLADQVTTVSRQLQRRFGGIIVPHGRDPSTLDPQRFDGSTLRAQLGLEAHPVVMFLGTPRPHKGLEDVIAALQSLRRLDVRLVVVGAGLDRAYEARLRETGGDLVRLLPQIPFAEVPRYLSAADLVVVPQRRGDQAHGQIPAKLFDAMAMAKPIIASATADIPEILHGCGMVVPAEDVAALAAQIDWTLSHRAEASELGLRARARCRAEYSLDVMEERLQKALEA
ncbi:MAG: glycosyltransferase family 4 protein [Planctomycetota bacterium]